MDQQKYLLTAVELDEEGTRHALVLGASGSARGLLGQYAERADRATKEEEWACRDSLCCLMADESVPVNEQETAASMAEATTFAGIAVRILFARLHAGKKGISVLPCDEKEHNGALLEENMIRCALLWNLGRDFLRWMTEENAVCSTLQDCAEWLIEADEHAAALLPVDGTRGAVRLVSDLTPYRERRRLMLGGSSALLAACAALCGIYRVGDAMRDDDIRGILARALTRVYLPVMPSSLEDTLQYAAHVCSYLENTIGAESWPVMGENLPSRLMSGVVPVLNTWMNKEGVLPAEAVFAISAAVMLLSSCQRTAEGTYELPGEDARRPVLDREAVLSAFSRMSCDMAPESLSYAALSDVEIWGCDLRELDGLEDAVANQLRDMQLLGVREAMRTAVTEEA